MMTPLVNIERLIEEIKKRPALYDKTLKEYSNLKEKKQMWLEVSEAAVPNWKSLGARDRIKECHAVQKKWANLRTCFRRELNAQKCLNSEQNVNRRRKYIYFDELSFLLPSVKSEPPEENHEGDNIQVNDVPVDDVHGYDEECDNDSKTSTNSKPIPRSKNVSGTEEETIAPAPMITNELLSTEVNRVNILDDDTNFVLSLVPSLQDLTAEENLDAKIAILKVFKQIRIARRIQLNRFSSPDELY